MSKTQNNKLPMIMLPVAMIVAGIVNSLPTTIVTFVVPFLQSNLGFTAVGSNVAMRIGSLIGSIGYIVVLVLFSLVCKGLQKKLCFVMSAYVGIIVRIIVNIASLLTSVLLCLLPDMDYAIRSLILGWGNAIGGFVYTIFEILVAVFFFKYLSSFTEKEAFEEDKPYKVKLLKPCIVIAGYGILSLIVGFVSSAIMTAFNRSLLTDTYGQIALSQSLNIVMHVILWGAIIGVTFLFKDKYQKLTLVGSIIVGNNVWGLVGILFGFITIFFPTISVVVSGISSFITTLLGIATGILIFYIANKKQYERIKK